MPLERTHIDNFQTRFYQSFFNMTAFDSTAFPATTTIRIQNFPGTYQEPLTSISTYDQFALRVFAPVLTSPT
jgi:hypothetical protein